MGYMTNLSILNDGWDLIKKNPEDFIREIESGMAPHSSEVVTYHSIKNFSSPVIVSRSMHADIPQLTLSHCNSMVALHMPQENLEDLHHFSYLQGSIATAQRVLDYAKQEVEDKVCIEVLRNIKAQGKDVTEMSDDELSAVIKNNAWAKEVSWKVNFLKLIRKNATRLLSKL